MAPLNVRDNMVAIDLPIELFIWLFKQQSVQIHNYTFTFLMKMCLSPILKCISKGDEDQKHLLSVDQMASDDF